MEISSITFGKKCYNPNFGQISAGNNLYFSKANLKADSFEPSFGLKPLAIPDGMFKTVEESSAFSKIVEEVRTGKISKNTAQKLVGNDCDTNLFPQIIDFIRANDNRIKLYDEVEFNNWFDYKMSEALVALNKEKALAFVRESNNLI